LDFGGEGVPYTARSALLHGMRRNKHVVSLNINFVTISLVVYTIATLQAVKVANVSPC
jgi:hypothetical protein